MPERKALGLGSSMPPLPIVLQNNVVDRVVDALHKQQPELQVPAEVVRATSEQYRLLGTRVRVGSLSATDSCERRAAVLLEFCARKITGRRLLSWSVLGAAVHVKNPASLQQFQDIVLNYLHQPSAGTQRRAAAEKSTAAKEGCQVSLRTRNHLVNYKDCKINKAAVSSNTLVARYEPKILPELVIRLAGHLVDPHGIQKLTVQLLQGIHAYYDNPEAGANCSVVERRGHLYDLQRYAAAYEAASLYQVVTTMGNLGGDVDSSAAMLTANNNKKSKKKGDCRKTKDEAFHAEDEDMMPLYEQPQQQQEQQQLHHLRPLELSDLVDASTEFTYLELKQVLPRVQELGREILEANQKQQRFEDSKQHATESRKRQPQRQASNHPHTQNDDDRPSIHELKTIAAPGTEHRSSRNRIGDDFIVPARPTFTEWKTQIISAARHQACGMLHGADDGDNVPIMTDREATALAADHVLRKYGLLPAISSSAM